MIKVEQHCDTQLNISVKELTSNGTLVVDVEAAKIVGYKYMPFKEGEISDTDRLYYLSLHERGVFVATSPYEGKFWLVWPNGRAEGCRWGVQEQQDIQYDTPNEAIDAAIREARQSC